MMNIMPKATNVVEIEYQVIEISIHGGSNGIRVTSKKDNLEYPFKFLIDNLIDNKSVLFKHEEDKE